MFGGLREADTHSAFSTGKIHFLNRAFKKEGTCCIQRERGGGGSRGKRRRRNRRGKSFMQQMWENITNKKTVKTTFCSAKFKVSFLKKSVWFFFWKKREKFEEKNFFMKPWPVLNWEWEAEQKILRGLPACLLLLCPHRPPPPLACHHFEKSRGKKKITFFVSFLARASNYCWKIARVKVEVWEKGERERRKETANRSFRGKKTKFEIQKLCEKTLALCAREKIRSYNLMGNAVLPPGPCGAGLYKICIWPVREEEEEEASVCFKSRKKNPAAI